MIPTYEHVYVPTCTYLKCIPMLMQVVLECRETQYITTIRGRRRYLPGINQSGNDRAKVWSAARVARSHA